MSDPMELSVPESAQFRNGLVFMIATSLTYLIAPVTYVGVLHATILESLKAYFPRLRMYLFLAKPINAANVTIRPNLFESIVD